MKRTLMIVVMIVACIALSSGYVFAIGGVCVNCHTMHNSQNGTVVIAGTAYGDPAYGMLLKNTCLGCHAQGGSTLIDAFNTPQVDPDGTAGTLAGGTFSYGATTASMSHNLTVLGAAMFGTDTLTVPPGDSTGGVVTAATVSCSGTRGCHGDRTIAGTGDGGDDLTALAGAHHSNNGTGGPTTGTVVGNSYRFLNGIYGFEQTTWESAPNATTHNQYYAVSGAADTHTISYLCAECHGVFHGTGNTGAASPFVRHPTDHIIPNARDYAAITGVAYDPVVPVGNGATAINATYTAGTDMVVCVSCHRAHGSNQPDLLRWDYNTMQAGTTSAAAGTGCFVCHTGKDGI